MLKVAVTVFAALIVSVHLVLLVESQPDQLTNDEPFEAVAVKVTDVLSSYVAVPMLADHEIEPVSAITEPLPVPDLFTVIKYWMATAGF